MPPVSFVVELSGHLIDLWLLCQACLSSLTFHFPLPPCSCTGDIFLASGATVAGMGLKQAALK